MILNGKEIRTALGAITVFQDIPLSHTKKRALSESEDNLLSSMFNTIMTKSENEYKKFKTSSNCITIKNRLSIKLDFLFSNREIKLLKEAVDVCIAESEMRQDCSINDYFNGDQYDICIDDFINLSIFLQKQGASFLGPELDLDS